MTKKKRKPAPKAKRKKSGLQKVVEAAAKAPPPVNLGPCRVCGAPAVEEINWPNFKGGGGKELYCGAHAEAAKRGEVPR